MANDAPMSTAKHPDTDQIEGGEASLIGRTVTINRPRSDVYAYWRDFQNLPNFMENVEAVRIIDDRLSHWTVAAPAGQLVEWDAIIVEDEPGRLIAWKSSQDAEIPNSGRIEFRDLSFGYSNEQLIFQHLNVTIPAGQRVGLVGFSGSGKSTFVSLILRLYDPQGGRILIDGHDIRMMTQDSLHSQLSLIPQDPNLFHRTLMENIRYGRLEATDDEIVDAARKAHADGFIRNIKDQYASLVGERGVKLSGGQRQRIAIARVVVKNAPILILDEATSSLDSITEQAIQETLNEVMQGKTVIVVAHRLSTIAHLDRILVFDQGRIVEDGTHDELLALGGSYHRLWSRQAGGFVLDDGAADKSAKDEEPADADEGPDEVVGNDRRRIQRRIY